MYGEFMFNVQLFRFLVFDPRLHTYLAYVIAGNPNCVPWHMEFAHSTQSAFESRVFEPQPTPLLNPTPSTPLKYHP